MGISSFESQRREGEQVGATELCVSLSSGGWRWRMESGSGDEELRRRSGSHGGGRREKEEEYGFIVWRDDVSAQDPPGAVAGIHNTLSLIYLS